jgi:hypothetical protein
LLTELILGTVFVASILNQLQFHWWERVTARLDKMVFLPRWAFFAPNPAYAGVHLVYRDRGVTGLSAWEEILLPSTTGWRWVWNPARYERKALRDLLGGLARSAQVLDARDRMAIEITNPYIILLTWVEAQPKTLPDATHRQFAILQTTGYGAARTVRPVFVSREHPHG